MKKLGLSSVRELFATLFLFVLAGFVSGKLLAAPAIPALTQPVMDEAGLLSPDAQQYLDGELQRLRAAGGSQIAVLIIPSLEGEVLESFSIKVTDQWKLGDASKDNGVLLLVSVKDRKARIEVGQGNEGVLTDVQTSRIIRERILPLFKQGDYNSGVIAGVVSIANLTDPDFAFSQGQSQRQVRGERRGGHNALPIIIFIIVVIILSMSNRRGGRGGGGGFGAGLGAGFLGGFGAGGGFGGGGGGSSGGFGGGGGGFSGGGASGEW